MSKLATEPPVLLTGCELWRGLVRLLAPPTIIGCGLLLGRVMLSPEWERAASTVGLAAVVLAALLHPAAGLLAWVLLAPFASGLYLRLELGRGIPNLDLTRVTAMLLLMQIMAGMIAQPRRNPQRLTRIEGAMIAFTGAMALSLAASPLGWVGGLQTIFDFVVTPFLAFYFARNWLHGRRWMTAMIEAIAVVSALLAFIAVREQLTGAAVFSPISYSIIYEGRIRKVLSIFGSPAAMSMALALAAPVLLYGLRHSEHRAGRIVLGATLLATLLGVFYSYVRAGWLGAVLGLAVALIASPAMRKTLIRLAPLIIVAVVALSMLTLVNTQAIEGRLTSEEPLTYRLDAWKLAWQIFRQSPLLGVGYGNYGYVAVRQFGWNPFSTDVEVYPSPHNSYLDIVTQGGLIAFLPYLAVFAFSFLRCLQLRRHALARRARPHSELAGDDLAVGELSGIIIATLAAYLVMIGTFDALNSQYANTLFFLIIGMLMGRLEQMVYHAPSADHPTSFMRVTEMSP